MLQLILILLICKEVAWGGSASKSLFFTPQEQSQHNQEKETHAQSLAHTLNAIFYRPDLGYWIVWINNQRIDSRKPRSLDGWFVKHVTFDSIRIRSIHGEEKELFLSFTAPASSEQEAQ